MRLRGQQHAQRPFLDGPQTVTTAHHNVTRGLKKPFVFMRKSRLGDSPTLSANLRRRLRVAGHVSGLTTGAAGAG